MSGETAQIAAIAVQVSAEIFSRFGWTRVGPQDHNFTGYDIAEAAELDVADEAALPESLIKPKSEISAEPIVAAPLAEKEFPADVVFSYIDPYSDNRIFIHFDLKSYAKSSLKANSTKKALKSLCKVIQVAESSHDWRTKFAQGESNYTIHGGLFVYNHDNEAPEKVDEFIDHFHSKSLPIPEGKRLYVFTPKRINYLLTVLSDMNALVAENVLPRAQEGEVSVFYPYGTQKPQKTLLKYAIAEQLLSPLLIQRFIYNATGTRGYVVHYDGTGDTMDEYLYLFEMFLKRGLLTDEEKVFLRLANAGPHALISFKDAKEFFVKSYHSLPVFEAQIDRVIFSRVTNVVRQFSTIDLGMQR